MSLDIYLEDIHDRFNCICLNMDGTRFSGQSERCVRINDNELEMKME